MQHHITAIHEGDFLGMIACHCSGLILVPRKYAFVKDTYNAWNAHLRKMEEE